LPWRSVDLKNPLHLAKLKKASPFIDALYALSTCRFSTGRHSSSAKCPGAHLLVLNLYMRSNHLVHSLSPRPPPPPDQTFNNVIAVNFLKDGPQLDAGRGFPPLCFYDITHCLMLDRFRDNPSLPVLTSFWHRFSDNMTIEECVGFCSNANMSYAGLENGVDCRKRASSVTMRCFIHASCMHRLWRRLDRWLNKRSGFGLQFPMRWRS
jgi:hypothetical protein